MLVVGKYGAQMYVRNYRRELETLEYKIRKNFNDMDFENADAQQKMADIVLKMLDAVSREKTKLDGYTFYEL